MRVPSGEPELVRAGAAGDPAAVAALWDAYGARSFAFSQRIVGRAELAADAAQDAFLLGQAQLPRLARAGEGFGPVLLSATRTTSYELLAREEHADGGRQGGPGLSAAVSRLRPQQRAALALAGLEGLSYAEIAPVLGIGVEAVPALLARARLRLHDELHGTALAAAAVRSPDCEDVLPLLAAAGDGELAAGEAAWADPHVTRCETCPRTRRALEEAAATYAAWSPAVPPSWLRTATLAEVGAEALGVASALAAAGSPPRRAGRRAAGTWSTPRPSLAAALMGATLLSVAFAALLLATVGALRQGDAPTGGTRMPDATRSLQVAAVPQRRATHRAHSHRAARRARRARPSRRSHRVAFVPVRKVTRRTPAVTQRPATGSAPSQPKRRAAKPTPRPKRSQPPTTAAPAAPAPPPLTPANPDAPADEPPNGSDGASTTAAPAAASPTASVPSPASVPAKVASVPPVSAPAAPAASFTARDDDGHGGGARKPCGRPQRCSHRSCQH